MKDERRGWTRFFMRVEDTSNHCVVRTDSGRECLACVEDISLGGARIRLSDDIRGGFPRIGMSETTSIQFSNCKLERWGRFLSGSKGVVRWVEEDECGCQFNHPLGLGS